MTVAVSAIWIVCSFLTFLCSVLYRCMCANNGTIQLLHVILTELVQLWSEWYYVLVFWMLPHPKSCTLVVWCVWLLLQLVSFIISSCNWVLACEFFHPLKLTSSILSFYVHSFKTVASVRIWEKNGKMIQLSGVLLKAYVKQVLWI
jgi:hypothetical protein